ERDLLHARLVPLAERLQRHPVACLRACYQDRVREPLVDERPVGPQLARDWTGSGSTRLHSGPTLVPMQLRPEVVVPRLRGSFGREYHWAEETPSTQRLLPAGA